MKKKHRTIRWMIGSLLVLSLAACQPDPEIEETTESSTTAAEITIEPVNLQDCRTKRPSMPPTVSLRTAKLPTAH